MKMAWKPIKSFKGEDREKVDIWMTIHPSPMSFGWGDSFRVLDCWREDGRWFHYHKGEKTELRAEYISHWCPILPDPNEAARAVAA